MTIGQRGIDLIKKYEGCKLTAYLCPAKVWTIGWGNTQYENGLSVKKGDTITQAEADRLFLSLVNGRFASGVQALLGRQLTQNQFDALVSFSYNCGLRALQSSTLLRKVKKDPLDPTIAAEFAKWNKAGGKVLNGLVRRRKAEADLYFS